MNLDYVFVCLLKKEAVYGKKLVGVERPNPHLFLTAAVGPKPKLLPSEPWCVSVSNSSRNSGQ